MVSKKEIFRWLIEDLHYKKYSTYNEAWGSFGERYYIEVTSRSKVGWTHKFYNSHVDMNIEFNCYFMKVKFHKSGNSLTLKLNKENEDLINACLYTFTKKEIPGMKTNINEFLNLMY